MDVYGEDEACWIRLFGVPGTQPGKIVAVIHDDSVTHPFYLIRMDNYTWPNYEVRDAYYMGKTASALIPTQHAFQGA